MKLFKLAALAVMSAGAMLAINEINKSGRCGSEELPVTDLSRKISFSNQEVFDLITGADIGKWFKTYGKDGCNMYVSYLNDNLLSLIDVDNPNILDKNQYLIQWVSCDSESTFDIVEYRIINFSMMEKKLKEILDKNNGIIVIKHD